VILLVLGHLDMKVRTRSPLGLGRGMRTSLNDKLIKNSRLRKNNGRPSISLGKKWMFFYFVNFFISTICLRGELKRNKTGAKWGELVTLLDEPFFFNYFMLKGRLVTK
jgi:hypothetical protein